MYTDPVIHESTTKGEHDYFSNCYSPQRLNTRYKWTEQIEIEHVYPWENLSDLSSQR